MGTAQSLFLGSLTVLLCLLSCRSERVESALSERESQLMTAEHRNFRNIPFKTITGNDTTLSAFDGKVILLVNTASECGYTPQYEGLQSLYEKFKDSGLVVVGFPANNYGQQEPGSESEIAQFCKRNYGVTFPMMAKVSVAGDDKHPLFAYLTELSAIPGEIKWNFSKFLIDRRGALVARFPSEVAPHDPHLLDKMRDLLNRHG